MYFMDSGHPLSSNGKVYYHRHAASMYLGRWLRKDEHVHHKDGDKLNNSRANLEVLSSSQHCALHNPVRRETIICPVCGSVCGIDSKKYCSVKCWGLSQRRAERPSVAMLLNDVELLGYCGTGRKYGVSDNAIRHWLKS